MGGCRGCSGTNWSMLACKGVYGSVGLRVGSRSCANVAAVPGAKGLAVSACRAAESSPWCTKCLARSARRSDEGAGWCVAAGGPAGSPSVGPVVANSCCHSPAWNAVTRARHSSFGKVRVPQGRCKSIRGNKSHSVHARVVSCSVCAARICSRLECNAALTLPRMNWGGVANVAVRVRSVPSKSMWSRVCMARLITASLLVVVLFVSRVFG